MVKYKLMASGDYESTLSIDIKGLSIDAYMEAVTKQFIEPCNATYDTFVKAYDGCYAVRNPEFHLLRGKTKQSARDTGQIVLFPDEDVSYLLELPLEITVNLYLSSEKETFHITPEDHTSTPKHIYEVQQNSYMYDQFCRTAGSVVYGNTATISVEKDSDFAVWATLNGLKPVTTHNVITRESVEERFAWVMRYFGQIDWIALKQSSLHNKFITVG